MPSIDRPELNPAQRQVLAQLGATEGERPTFPDELRGELRNQLERGLAPLLAELGPDEDLVISKHLLQLVHGCEGRLLAEEADGGSFVVSVPIARGTVAHKAIELGIHWRGDAPPLDLVDEALARLTESEHWLAEWLQKASEGDRAELRSTAGDRVAKFQECFPPLSARWRPVTESSLIVELFDGRVRLRGKVDLTIGRALGQQAGKVIVDLKTGSPNPNHRDDLRFYALLEAVRLGVPPRLVASYYLDLGEARSEEVTEPILQATVERTVDGARRIVDLRNGSVAPVLRPSWGCRWCPARPACATGQAHLAELDDVDELDPLAS